MEMTAPVVLNEAEMEHIHRESLLILEQAGVRVLDAECRSLLVKAGARTDPGGERVYLPRELIEERRQSAPPSFRLYRRGGGAVEVDTSSRVFGSLVIDPWIIASRNR